MIEHDRARLDAFRMAAMTADLVSFDLFDTLLQRAVWRPEDLFALVAASMTPPADRWFAAARGAAEASVRRQAGGREITLAAIYDVMRCEAPPGFDPDAAMAREVALEIEGVAADPLVAEVFRAVVAAGRRVIIVSDMYLPRAAIEAMLERAGVVGHRRLYLSSETSLTKAGGTVWPAIRTDFGLGREARIVHCGDHPVADGTMARRHGVTPFLLTPPDRRGAATRYPPTGDAVTDLPHALLRRALAADRGDPYWLTLAYLVVAPAAIGMAGMIHAKARAEHRRVFFLARDGMVFQKAYEAAWRGADMPESSYVWSSRRCLNLASITTLEAADLDFLTSGVSELTMADYLRRADLDPGGDEVAAALRRQGVSEATGVTGAGPRAALRAVFADLSGAIAGRAAIERRDLLVHLDALGLFDVKSLVVDLGWHGSLQRALLRLGTTARGQAPDMAGVYLGTSSARVKGLAAEGFLFTDGAPAAAVAATVGRSYEVLELLFSAPESGISHVACRNGVAVPVRIEQAEEAPRLAIAALIHEAVVEVARAMRPYLRPEYVAMLRGIALSRLSALLENPDRNDAAHFALVPHAEGFGVSSYRPIVPPSSRLPLAAARAARTAFWPAGFMARLDPGSRFAVRAINRVHRRISATA